MLQYGYNPNDDPWAEVEPQGFAPGPGSMPAPPIWAWLAWTSRTRALLALPRKSADEHMHATSPVANTSHSILWLRRKCCNTPRHPTKWSWRCEPAWTGAMGSSNESRNGFSISCVPCSLQTGNPSGFIGAGLEASPRRSPGTAAPRSCGAALNPLRFTPAAHLRKSCSWTSQRGCCRWRWVHFTGACCPKQPR